MHLLILMIWICSSCRFMFVVVTAMIHWKKSTSTSFIFFIFYFFPETKITNNLHCQLFTLELLSTEKNSPLKQPCTGNYSERWHILGNCYIFVYFFNMQVAVAVARSSHCYYRNWRNELLFQYVGFQQSLRLLLCQRHPHFLQFLLPFLFLLFFSSAAS